MTQTECLAQQETIVKLSANVEQLTRSKATISAELSATVKQLEKMKSLDKDTKGKLEADIKILQTQYDSLTEKERKVTLHVILLVDKVIFNFHIVIIISEYRGQIIK